MQRFIWLLIGILSINQSIKQTYADPIEPTPMIFHDQLNITHFIPARSSITFPLELLDYIDMTVLIWTNASLLEASIVQLNNQTVTFSQLPRSQETPIIILPTSNYNDHIQPTLVSVCDSINLSRNLTTRTCTVNITLYNRDYVDHTYMHTMTQMMNIGPDDSLTASVNRGSWAYFAMQLTRDETSVLISLSMASEPAGQNVDLYIANEDAATSSSYIFPYGPFMHEPGEDLKLLLGPDKDGKFTEGIWVFAIYSPIATPAARTSFGLEFVSGVGRTNSFTAGLFGIIGALIVLVLCLFAAAALVARNRRRSAITMTINQSLAQLQNGESATVFVGTNGRMMMVTVHPVHPPPPTGVPREQIDALPIFVYRKFTDDEGRCTICLEDYVNNVTKLKRLPCGHEFDCTCIDTWLMSHKQCPLCQQNIDTAHDVAKHDTHPSNTTKPTRTITQSREIELQSHVPEQHVVVVNQQEECKESV